MPPRILLSSHRWEFAADVAAILAESGFEVQPHAAGSTCRVDFEGIEAAVIVCEDDPSPALNLIRRWRAELAYTAPSILIVLPAAAGSAAVRLLDAGAEAAIARPVEPAILAAQVRAAARSHRERCRLINRAAESRLLGEQLSRLRSQLDREHAAARQLHAALQARPLPEFDRISIQVNEQPRRQVAGPFHLIHRLNDDQVLIAVGDVGAAGAAAPIIGLLVAALAPAASTRDPGDFLALQNDALLGLDLEEPPLVAMAAAIVHGETGQCTVARAGLPAPLLVPAAGESSRIASPGPFLGISRARFPAERVQLHSGDRLVFVSAGFPDCGEARGGSAAAPGDSAEGCVESLSITIVDHPAR